MREGEYAFIGSLFFYSEYLCTRSKLGPLQEKARFYYMLFSANGFDERLTAVAKESGAQLYDLEQIVSAAELF